MIYKQEQYIEITHAKYVEMMSENPEISTSDSDKDMGLKFLCKCDNTEYVHDTRYVFEIIDPVKLTLYRLKYEF